MPGLALSQQEFSDEQILTGPPLPVANLLIDTLHFRNFIIA